MQPGMSPAQRALVSKENTMAETPVAHPMAALKLSRRVKDVIAFAKSVATAMTNNPSFPAPNPPLATFEADIAALDVAEAGVLSRTKGAKQTRDVKLAAVHADLQLERAYVQEVALANPTTAAAIIQSAGMHIKTVTLHAKGDLVAKAGKVSGTASLVARSAARRASYEWQYSTDQKTWALGPVTLQARTEIVGLAAGTTYFFRVRPVTKSGEGNWSQTVSLLVG
jgi:hypothetical protein